MSEQQAPSSHSHSHDHGLEGGWRVWAADPILRTVLVAVAVAAVVTIVAVVALWPTGEGRQSAIDNADEFGLATDRLTATVEEVRDRRCSYSTADDPQDCRTLTLVVHEGPEPGAVVALPEINLNFDYSIPQLAVGDRVIVGYEDSTNFYFYADQDRRSSLVWLAGLFAVVVIALGRFRGVLALLAMAATLVVLVAFVAPSVLDGNDPLLVAVVAASAIAFISLYLTHGFTPTTTVALAGTLAALGLTLGLSWLFFELAAFTGLATEEALILPFIAENLDVSALLLGGAVIGALGALDDVTVTQVSTVAELRRHSPHLPTTELVASGIRVGRDHIASTVNTLLLAYAGASMPLILLFAVSDQPLDMVANSELIGIEIVRTLCGSIGLVAAVPITTALAAAVLRPAAAGSAAGGDGDVIDVAAAGSAAGGDGDVIDVAAAGSAAGGDGDVIDVAAAGSAAGGDGDAIDVAAAGSAAGGDGDAIDVAAAGSAAGGGGDVTDVAAAGSAAGGDGDAIDVAAAGSAAGGDGDAIDVAAAGSGAGGGGDAIDVAAAGSGAGGGGDAIDVAAAGSGAGGDGGRSGGRSVDQPATRDADGGGESPLRREPRWADFGPVEDS